jgi:hypothetical protein
MNTADIYQPIVATSMGTAPITLRVITTPNNMEYVGGVPSTATRAETYVLYSALPDDLKERVRVAVQALITAG